MSETSLRGRLLSGGTWILLGKLSTATTTILVGALAARMMDDDAFAGYVLCFSVVTVATMVAQLGLQRAVIRLVAEEMALGRPGRARATVGLVFRLCLLGIALVAAFLLLGGGRLIAVGLFDSSPMAAVLPWLALWIAGTALAQLASESFRGFQDLLLAPVFGGVISGWLTLMAVVGVFAAGGSLSLERIVAISALAALTSAVTALPILRGRVKALGPPDPVSARRVLSVGGPMMVTVVTAFLLNQADLWVLGAFRPKGEVAYYGAAVRLVNLVAMPLMMVNLVVPPFVAQLYSQGQKALLQRTLRTTATLAGLPALAVLGLFIFAGGPILALVYREEFRAGALVLALLSVGRLLMVWVGSAAITLSMTGHHGRLMRITLISTGATLVGLLLVVERFGAAGVAGVAGSGIVLQNGWLWLATRRATGLWTHVGGLRRADVRTILDQLRRLRRGRGGAVEP